MCPESEICEQIQGLRRHPEHDRATPNLAVGYPASWLRDAVGKMDAVAC